MASRSPVVDLAFLCCVLWCRLVSSELIFRGTCTSIFHPQEVAITVNTADVVFNRYLIQPGNKLVNNSDACQADCLGTAKPAPCRSAIYDPTQNTCWLLRADKQTALEFDTREGVNLVYGILIAPQTIVDGAIDRTLGVVGCSAFCPAPAVQSADTITPVCIQDCPGTTPLCAGELANCMDHPRRVWTSFYTTVNSPIAVSPMPYQIWTTTITKKYDYTSIRVTFQVGAWSLTPGTSAGYNTEGFIYANVNGQVCIGEAGHTHMMYRELAEGFSSTHRSEPAHGEFSCTYYDAPSGTYTVDMLYDYRKWNSRFGTFVMPGVVVAPDYSPNHIHVEEYIPARSGNFKLDDMARCQSATVFNSQSTQWSGESNTVIPGQTSFAVWKYKKRSDTSTLRIKWAGQIWWNVIQKTMRLYITINDQPCANPYPIETCLRDINYGTGYSRHSPNSFTTPIDGICRGLPAGRYDIRLWADNKCSFYGLLNNPIAVDIGHGKPASMIVEEINENLPINSVLLSDGTMMKLPYYNRQYFSFADICENPAGSACFNPFKTLTYTKLQANSVLHVKWFGTQQLCTYNAGTYLESVKYYIKFNNQDCNNPGRLESWWHVDGMPVGQCDLRPKYVEGTCKMAFPAGPVTLTLLVGRALTTWGTFTRYHAAGNGGISYLMVEELYDGNI